ncbi:hypothetical protein [Kribbella hippodromi]
MTERERIRELGRVEGERLRKVRPITEAEQQQLRDLIGDCCSRDS